MVNNKKTKTKTAKVRVFSKNDFYSGDGFLTAVWGPAQWHMLHTISFNYPVQPTTEQKHQYRNYVLSLQHVLPCKYCRMNLTTNFAHLPLTMKQMENRDSFSRYIYALHERVNKMLHKKSNLSYCDVRERYEHFRSRCTDPPVALCTKTRKHKKKTEKEKGCTTPLYGTKSRCIIKIVPQEDTSQTMQIDDKCVKHK